MNNVTYLLVTLLIRGCRQDPVPSATVTITGEHVVWHPLTFTFYSPETSEQAPLNPFLHYRLNAWFSLGGDSVMVPGYYAADGDVANTGASGGGARQVKFTPPKSGSWNYGISFREGKNIALSDRLDAGQPVSFDGSQGSFQVDAAAGANASGFYARGPLQYSGSRYRQYAGSGGYFLKGGSDSPDNFSAFAEFDDTPPRHHYQTHVQDWREGDPLWQGNKGKKWQKKILHALEIVKMLNK